MTFKLKKIVLSVSLVFTILPVMAADDPDPSFNWDPVIDAIIEVESEGNGKAICGSYVGAMQIAPVLVEECNAILKSRGLRKRYRLTDRFSVRKSREMFKLYQSFHNPTHNVEKAIRSWNGGKNYKVRSTNRYYRKVMARLNN